MRDDATSTAGTGQNSPVRPYAKVLLWLFAGSIVVPLGLYVGGYFMTVQRMVWFKTVHEPPPSILSHQVCINGGPFIPKKYQRLFRPMYEIDRKWIRPKYWVENPRLTTKEEADSRSVGVLTGVLK